MGGGPSLLSFPLGHIHSSGMCTWDDVHILLIVTIITTCSSSPSSSSSLSSSSSSSMVMVLGNGFYDVMTAHGQPSLRTWFFSLTPPLSLFLDSSLPLQPPPWV
mmetsp:Transcript_8211/g.15477  ORF Transcript_8211/g.15477 Transcript_8211/m.15477 type:complete len:104 (-) Transcript_8211:280-591(-)